MNTRSIAPCFTLIASLLVSACSSHIPPEINQPLQGSPSLGQAQADPDEHISQKIRWGGIILNTENKQDASYLTIIAFPIDDNGRVDGSAQPHGRFIAKFNAFMEPQLYAPNREITLYGSILKFDTIKIGEYPYLYPVIQVDQHQLWPIKQATRDYDYPPYWYDPWYYPYYPRYYPYHPHRH